MTRLDVPQFAIVGCNLLATIAMLPWALLRACQAYKLVKEIRAHQKANAETPS